MTPEQQDDLAYLRQLAEAGSKAKLLGGRFYVFWGVLTSAAYLGQWAILSERFGLPPVAFAWLWISFGVIAGVSMPILVRSIRNKPGQGSANNRIEDLVWKAFGTSLMTFVIGCLIATIVMGKSAVVWDFLMAIFFAGYGAALLTTGAFSSLKWMELPGYGSIAAVALVPVFSGTPTLYLIAPVIVVLISVVPGIVLLANEPASLPEEA